MSESPANVINRDHLSGLASALTNRSKTCVSTAPSIVIKVSTLVRRKAPMTEVLGSRYPGSLTSAHSPCGARAWVRVITVLTANSSMKTRRSTGIFICFCANAARSTGSAFSSRFDFFRESPGASRVARSSGRSPRPAPSSLAVRIALR